MVYAWLAGMWCGFVFIPSEWRISSPHSSFFFHPLWDGSDFYYIFEISVIFRDYLDTLEMNCRNLERTFRTQIRDFKGKAAICFASISSEGPTLALEVFRGNKSHATDNQVELTAEMIHRSVSKLLGALE